MSLLATYLFDSASLEASAPSRGETRSGSVSVGELQAVPAFPLARRVDETIGERRRLLVA